ncbi:sulfotransferase family protein [Acuticoccus kandeliae]|uniref:sulfotransferase family protein n=1 Tax=Acuticoccus kandeliae TaxID=2073160 RepID=UPI000D3E0D6F|nr:sulfotransferase family protein [Acuticoccus kandeliae]
MPLDIVGAGFGRTGTNSLKLALEALGFGPCHHMLEVRAHPEQQAHWCAIAAGAAPDWDAVFAGYRAEVDWPGARFWRELADHYPDAKVILTVRDPDAWFDSVQATIYPFMEDPSRHEDPMLRARAEMAHALIVRQIFDGRLDDRAHAIGVFQAHIAEVQRTIAADRLLTYDIRSGWEPLCDFLDVPVPPGPMPHENTRSAFKARGPGPVPGPS